MANFKHDYRLALYHDDLPIISVANILNLTRSDVHYVGLQV